MTLHFVKLAVGNKNYKVKVSTQGCADVADFRDAIKCKLANLLKNYAAYHLTLFQPDGVTEIDPGEIIETLNKVGVGPWNPLVVTVDELPVKAPVSSSKKQLTYRGMSTEASYGRFFDALAAKLALFYEFDWGVDISFPTIGDALEAVKLKTWKYQKRQTTLAERINESGFVEPPTKVPRLPIPLSELFNQAEWKKIDELNRKITDRIHDARLPRKWGKAFIILPASEFNDETIRFFKEIGVKGKLFTYEDDFVVKNEADLSGI